MTDKVRENRLRRKADRLGYILRKSRRRDPDAYDYGLYGLLDVAHGGTPHPSSPMNTMFDLVLDDVEWWLEKLAS